MFHRQECANAGQKSHFCTDIDMPQLQFLWLLYILLVWVNKFRQQGIWSNFISAWKNYFQLGHLNLTLKATCVKGYWLKLRLAPQRSLQIRGHWTLRPGQWPVVKSVTSVLNLSSNLEQSFSSKAKGFWGHNSRHGCEQSFDCVCCLYEGVGQPLDKISSPVTQITQQSSVKVHFVRWRDTQVRCSQSRAFPASQTMVWRFCVRMTQLCDPIKIQPFSFLFVCPATTTLQAQTGQRKGSSGKSWGKYKDKEADGWLTAWFDATWLLSEKLLPSFLLLIGWLPVWESRFQPNQASLANFKPSQIDLSWSSCFYPS